MLKTDLFELATRESISFIEPGLGATPEPFRLLEVGCGKGHLAAALARRGLSVLGIDLWEEAVAATRALGVDCIHGDFLMHEDEPFDCVFFGRSLHHVERLDLALDRVCALLKRDGMLLVEEFAYEQADQPSLSWLAEKRAQAQAAGLLENLERHAEATSGSLERWRVSYQKHRIAESQTMLHAVRQVFSDVKVETAPYLYRYILDIVRADALGFSFLEAALAEEKSLIAAGRIKAIGWRLRCRQPLFPV